MLTVIYLGEYGLEEQSRLTGAIPAVDVQRWTWVDENRAIVGPAVVRAKGLRVGDHAKLDAALSKGGGRLVGSPEAVALVSSVARTHHLVAPWTPKTVVAPSGITAAELLDLARRGGLNLPVFVRSEMESAAKYVGVDGCIVRDGDPAAVESVLVSLRAHVSGFNEVVVKEVRPLSEESRPAEYRALGYRGMLIGFDQPAGVVVVPHVTSVAVGALRALAAAGADGPVLLDVGLDQQLEPFVIEWKDFSGGSLRHPIRLFADLAAAVDSESRSI